MKIYGLTHWVLDGLAGVGAAPMYDLLVDYTSRGSGHEFGFTWRHRGLWCGLRRKFRSDSRPSWFAVIPDGALLGKPWDRVFTRDALASLFDTQVCQIPKSFPGDLVHYALRRVSPSANGFDGIPFAVHKIEDRNVRRAAAASFQQNQ